MRMSKYKDKGKELCMECLKLRERCKAVTVDPEGEIGWVCPSCFRNFDYDKFMHAPQPK